MKVKGLEDKIYRLNPNSINFSVGDLAKLKEGKSVGLFKDRIEEAILDGEIKNNYDSAYDFMLKIKNEILNH